MRPEDIKALMRLGVPLAAIETLCAAPVTIILGQTAELYEPHETGIPAWLRPGCFFEEPGLPLQTGFGRLHRAADLSCWPLYDERAKVSHALA
jgi:hypothetical protein